LLLCLLLVLFLCLGKRTQLVIPFRFQGVGDQAIIRINFHETAASKFGLVLCPLNVLPPQVVGTIDRW